MLALNRIDSHLQIRAACANGPSHIIDKVIEAADDAFCKVAALRTCEVRAKDPPGICGGVRPDLAAEEHDELDDRYAHHSNEPWRVRRQAEQRREPQSGNALARGDTRRRGL